MKHTGWRIRSFVQNLGIALIPLVGLRIWQELSIVEEQTGFWTGSSPTIWIFYGVLALATGGTLLVSVLQRSKTALDHGRRPRRLEGFLALVAAGTLLWSALMAVADVLGQLSRFATTPLRVNESLLVYFLRTGIFSTLGEALFGFIALFAFVQIALVDLRPQSKLRVNRFLLLMPLLWTVCRLLRCFSRTISYLRVSDLFLTLMFLTALMTFFLAFAQQCSGISAEKKSPIRLLAAGFPAAMFGLLTFVPRLVALLGGRAPSVDAVLNPTDLAISLFLFSFLSNRLIPVAPPEEISEHQKNKK